MNEMDVLTRLRDEVPVRVSPRAEHLFLAGLADRAAARRTWRLRLAGPGWRWSGWRWSGWRWRGRRWRGWRWRGRVATITLLAAGLAAGTVVAVVAALPAASPAPATSAVQLLADRAATVALAGPSVSPGQWVYREIGGGGAKIVQSWATADDRAEAAYIAGTLLTCQSGGHCQPAEIDGQRYGLAWPATDGLSYAALASLPADPRVLVTRLEQIAGYPAGQRAEGAFDLIGRLMVAYLMPPALTAEFYRALADIPGVTVVRDAPDPAGQRGTAFRISAHGSGSSWEEIIINPTSYHFMSWAYPSAKGLAGDAVLAQALVLGPGVPPARAADSS